MTVHRINKYKHMCSLFAFLLGKKCFWPSRMKGKNTCFFSSSALLKYTHIWLGAKTIQYIGVICKSERRKIYISFGLSRRTGRLLLLRGAFTPSCRETQKWTQFLLLLISPHFWNDSKNKANDTLKKTDTLYRHAGQMTVF